MAQVLDKMQDAGSQGLIISRLTQKANLSHDRLISLTSNLIGSGLITKIQFITRVKNYSTRFKSRIKAFQWIYK